MTSIRAFDAEVGLVSPSPEDEVRATILPVNGDMPVLKPDDESTSRHTGGSGRGSDTMTTTARSENQGDGGSPEDEGEGMDLGTVFSDALEDARSVLDGEMPDTASGWAVVAAVVLGIVALVRS